MHRAATEPTESGPFSQRRIQPRVMWDPAADLIVKRWREMQPFDDAAYTMAAVSATVALYRVLVRKGVLTRDEAVRVLLDEAVARAIQAEAQYQGDAKTTDDLNRQCAEILKFIADKL